MRGQTLRSTLKQGERVYGMAVQGYGQPQWPRLFSRIGLDFVFMDSEHTPQNRETIAWAAEAYAANGIAPLLRIPEPSATLAAMGLDAGAHGIIVPYVETVAQVKAVVGAVKYRPLKGAALEEALDTGRFPNPETRAYLHDYNRDSVLVIMIESPAGIAALPELLRVPGVDVVLMGPHDISVSHGVPEQYDHPVFRAAIQQVITTCNQAGVAVGIHYIAGDVERAQEWIEWGCTFISQRSDTLFTIDGARAELSILAERLGGRLPGGAAEERPGPSGQTL